MNLLLAAVIGLMVAVAILHLLQRETLRVIVGLYMGWNALNLILLACGRLRGTRAPVLGEGSGPMADPVVQSLVLTAIVITFGFTFFLVTLAFWLARGKGTIDLQELREAKG